MALHPHPILLIHGIDDTAVVFDKMAAYLSDRLAVPVHTLNLAPNNGDLGLDELALQVKAYIDQHIDAAMKLDLVGFSMGGIVSRYYVQRLAGWQRVRRFVTLSSPHNGTWSGFLRNNIGAAQMRPNSSFLHDLNQSLDELTQVEFTSLWTPYDLMIVPASSSRLPLGTMRQLPVLLHPWMLVDERSLATVADILGN
ncbi:alpha/beta fold hydrolase [Oscillatoria sp. CS-180]|uniref:esterase/lipase family protein n=1 Tax=Oscillatoria sp. CS-180 TaxID=3021720 RepID=UPI00232F5209|nr:alpha/beta fold hydrolase [Oscillatoria sp. CS-180]MDB9525036.1 alpha/beta fold hydrolase [Oscillatoria sp. CS-180]